MDSVTRKLLRRVVLDRLALQALLKQAKKDRDGGKTLCPKMDDVVNIYSRIMTDYPEPVTQGVAQ